MADTQNKTTAAPATADRVPMWEDGSHTARLRNAGSHVIDYVEDLEKQVTAAAEGRQDVLQWYQYLDEPTCGYANESDIELFLSLVRGGDREASYVLLDIISRRVVPSSKAEGFMSTVPGYCHMTGKVENPFDMGGLFEYTKKMSDHIEEAGTEALFAELDARDRVRRSGE